MLGLDYFEVKYWTRVDWAKRVAKNNTETQPSPRGESWCTQGDNVLTMYIGSFKGELVSGTRASEIQKYVRSIWKGLYN